MEHRVENLRRVLLIVMQELGELQQQVDAYQDLEKQWIEQRKELGREVFETGVELKKAQERAARLETEYAKLSEKVH